MFSPIYRINFSYFKFGLKENVTPRFLQKEKKNYTCSWRLTLAVNFEFMNSAGLITGAYNLVSPSYNDPQYRFKAWRVRRRHRTSKLGSSRLLFIGNLSTKKGVKGFCMLGAWPSFHKSSGALRLLLFEPLPDPFWPFLLVVPVRKYIVVNTTKNFHC